MTPGRRPILTLYPPERAEEYRGEEGHGLDGAQYLARQIQISNRSLVYILSIVSTCFCLPVVTIVLLSFFCDSPNDRRICLRLHNAALMLNKCSSLDSYGHPHPDFGVFAKLL